MKIFRLIILLLILSIIVLSCNNKKEETIKKEEITENTYQTKRYGSFLVGFVDMPNDWFEFEDPDAMENAVQLAVTPYDIITLNIYSVNNQRTAEEWRKILYKKYINQGISNDNITQKDVKINGYNAKQIAIKIPDGRELTMNLIDYEGKVYYIALEGMPDKKSELEKVVNTWKPNE
ncbi:hypothetical protein [Pseudoleptotrichia goodfellowii]|uniref:Lipoprotein n=1 Tax=Pseudoleptotrichia goodfellowii TaxID=157692 RepID=A0A510JC68_9FUSO|nr:hypothetical protein [Pseudoleptotrichia goodfellowii]BBM36900.1 hypothetical protein JCM16774_1846 [Pseudoleptotrichia goodfellowii]